MKYSELFRKAAAVFKRHRWVQEKWESKDPTCGYCILGAIGKVEGKPKKYQSDAPPGSNYLIRAIEKEFPERLDYSTKRETVLIYSFNDHTETKRKDVLKVLQIAQELAAKDNQ